MSKSPLLNFLLWLLQLSTITATFFKKFDIDFSDLKQSDYTLTVAK